MPQPDHLSHDGVCGEGPLHQQLEGDGRAQSGQIILLQALHMAGDAQLTQKMHCCIPVSYPVQQRLNAAGKDLLHRAILGHLQAWLDLHRSRGYRLIQDAPVGPDHGLTVAHGPHQGQASKIGVIAHMPDHRVNRACCRELKGPINAEEMGI